MDKSVILQTPPALVLYGAALLLCLVDRIFKFTRGIFTYISAALAIGTTAYVLLTGASAWEAATVLLIFLLLNMGVRE